MDPVAGLPKMERDRSMAISRRCAALVASLAALAVAGCLRSGDELPREPVSGTVNLDGQPLAHGSIQFTPARTDGGTPVVGGSPIENGRFSIARENGLVPGEYKVAIYSAEQKEAATSKGPIRKGTVLAKERIPAKYNSMSKLTAEVKKGGSPELKYDLESQ
jgi:hypothetical protein